MPSHLEVVNEISWRNNFSRWYLNFVTTPCPSFPMQCSSSKLFVTLSIPSYTNFPSKVNIESNLGVYPGLLYCVCEPFFVSWILYKMENLWYLRTIFCSLVMLSLEHLWMLCCQESVPCKPALVRSMLLTLSAWLQWIPNQAHWLILVVLLRVHEGKREPLWFWRLVFHLKVHELPP